MQVLEHCMFKNNHLVEACFISSISGYKGSLHLKGCSLAFNILCQREVATSVWEARFERTCLAIWGGVMLHLCLKEVYMKEVCLLGKRMLLGGGNSLQLPKRICKKVCSIIFFCELVSWLYIQVIISLVFFVAIHYWLFMQESLVELMESLPSLDKFLFGPSSLQGSTC